MGNYGRKAQKQAYCAKFQAAEVSERKAAEVSDRKAAKPYNSNEDNETGFYTTSNGRSRQRSAACFSRSEEEELIAERAAQEEAKRLAEVDLRKTHRTLADLCRIEIWKHQSKRNQFAELSRKFELCGLEPKMS